MYIKHDHVITFIGNLIKFIQVIGMYEFSIHCSLFSNLSSTEPFYENILNLLQNYQMKSLVNIIFIKRTSNWNTQHLLILQPHNSSWP